ncbi:MAG: D-alanine--D-alanine ligase [Sedimentisphaerales bacterium]|nr:D-alanine--D-alanine ligase [Sedimentisphaerales bacterium]MBN2842774.1 D-alanine--D-alanine ligase [Sedimentisphaerales bacterium]
MSYQTTNPLRIMVLCGGISSEREVSLKSGSSVINALKQAGHEVVSSDISPQNLCALDTPDIDVIFPVLHGKFGEDGQLQQIMEARSLKFIGSGSQASCLAMDKWLSKELFIQNGIAVTQGRLLRADQCAKSDKAQLADELVRELGLPLVLKPVCEGSSVGVYLEKSLAGLAGRLEAFFPEFGDCLVERFNTGGEYTVGIVCREVLPVIQIKAANSFYDYQAKYQSNDTNYLFETELDSVQLKQMQAFALKAWDLLNCQDLARIDFMVEPDSVPQLLEVNTLPGFTDHSLVPKAAAKKGYSMPEICDKIVQNCFKRSI